MYTIEEGRNQIILSGMSREDWETLQHVLMYVMDEGNVLYPGTYTNDETIGETIWTSEYDSEMNIQAAYIYSKEDGEANSNVVFDKEFFELYVLHVCREVFNFEVPRINWENEIPRAIEFWRIADEISRAWPHPHIDW